VEKLEQGRFPRRGRISENPFSPVDEQSGRRRQGGVDDKISDGEIRALTGGGRP